MAVSDISSKRSLWSYAKVQRAVSRLIRNKRAFFSKRAASSKYLNLGCGLFPLEGFANLDWHWCPGVDVCWDLRKPLPFPDDHFQGIYSEHCIDGLPREHFKPVLREMCRVLKPGGTLRISFCDSEIYVDAYVKNRADKNNKMPFADERGHRLGMESLDWIFHHVTHQTLVDFERLKTYMTEAGFKDITRVSFMQGRDPHLLHDQEARSPESLYVEASK